MESKKTSKKIYHIVIAILLIITIALTIYVAYLTKKEAREASNTEVGSVSVEVESSSLEEDEDPDESKKDQQGVPERQLSADELFLYQEDIKAKYNYDKDLIANESYKYFPLYPHETVQSNANQLEVPLFILRDPQWAYSPYGDDSSMQLWENGCAIASLAMIHSTLSDTVSDPTEILQWAGNRFYIHGHGTSWNIYEAFAHDYGYSFVNYGSDFYGAMEEVQAGNICLVSTEPGRFTTVGHMLIVRGYEPGFVYLNDSNDSIEKLYSFRPIPESWIIEDGLNYWVFSKKGY